MPILLLRRLNQSRRTGSVAQRQQGARGRIATAEGKWQQTKIMLLCLLTLGFYVHTTSIALAGETIYKSIEPNGEISYSLRPDPGASHVETIEVDKLSPEQRRAIKRFQQEETKAGRAADTYALNVETQLSSIDAEIKQAHAELRNAEAALEAGRTPLPGERRGNKGGGSRLLQAYFDRLHDLELRIERARQRLDRAYDARNALR